MLQGVGQEMRSAQVFAGSTGGQGHLQAGHLSTCWDCRKLLGLRSPTSACV